MLSLISESQLILSVWQRTIFFKAFFFLPLYYFWRDTDIGKRQTHKEVVRCIKKWSPGYQLLNSDFFPLSFSEVFIQICLIGGQRQSAGHPISWNPSICNFALSAVPGYDGFPVAMHKYILRFIFHTFKMVTKQQTGPFRLRSWCGWACSISGVAQKLSSPRAICELEVVGPTREVEVEHRGRRWPSWSYKGGRGGTTW